MSICGKRESLPTVQDLWSFFEVSLLRAPNSVAIVDAASGEQVTFSQFSSRVNQLARFFLRLIETVNDYPDGKRPFAVCIPPSVDLVASLFALLQIKRSYIPIDDEFPASRVSLILKDAKPQFVITKGKQAALSELRATKRDDICLIDLDESEQEIRSELNSPIEQEVEPNDVLLILYTSGSTGIPKGARLLQSSVLNRLVWEWRTFPYDQNEVFCFKTTITFIDSVIEIFGSLLTGHQLVILPKRFTKQPERMVKILDQFQIQRLFLVPSLLRSILLHASRIRNPLPRLKVWICSGEILPIDLIYSFFDIFRSNQTLCNFYGCTEVTGDASFIQFTGSADIENFIYDNKVSIGRPLSNVDIYLINKNMEQVPDGEVGELLVAGLNLAGGYVGDTQTNKFIANSLNSEAGYTTLYRTGDFARYVNGQLIFEGRIDSQLKIRGHRVDLSEIELTIQRIKGIDKCCVVCHRPREIDQIVVAFFTSKNKDITSDYIKSEMVLSLPLYMQPQLLKIEEMPFLVNGKVDRQSLLRLFEDRGNKKSLRDIKFDLSSCIEEKEEAAKVLLKTLIKILGPSAPSSIALNQSFWEIGGNSLNAILAITSYQDAGYYVGVTEFLSAESLNDIVKAASKIDQHLFSRNDVKSKMNEDQTYSCFPIKDEDKETVISIVSKSFVYKGDTELLLGITEHEFKIVMEQIFDKILDRSLSFVVSRKGEDEIIAVSINGDYNKIQELKLDFSSKNIEYNFEYLEECEEKIRKHLPQGVGKTLHGYLGATRDDVLPRENVALIRVMEENAIKVAREHGYEAIFTINTSRVTQHVCEDLLPYKALAAYQLNTWITKDGTRPFKDADDSQVAVCSALFLEDFTGN